MLTNCVITGNRTCGEGGGIWCGGPWHSLKYCTVADNSGVKGGSIYCNIYSPELIGCIVWGDGGIEVYRDPNYPGSDPKVSFSCTQGEEAWPGQGNINGDPLFLKRGHWDGNGTADDSSDDVWIQGDYRLRSGSPCIDAGPLEGAPSFDIDGMGRACGGAVDMGAYEMGRCAAGVSFLRGDANSDTERDIGDAIFFLVYLFSAGPAPQCLDAGDVNDDGTLDLADAMGLLAHVFASTGDLPAPFLDCGADPTADELSCESFSGCEGQ